MKDVLKSKTTCHCGAGTKDVRSIQSIGTLCKGYIIVNGSCGNATNGPIVGFHGPTANWGLFALIGFVIS